MIETDDKIGTATFAAGCRALALDAMHRRSRSEPIDALAEPKSASARLISCVHFVAGDAGKPFIVWDRPLQHGAVHFSDPLPPEVGAMIASPLRAGVKSRPSQSRGHAC